MNNPKIMAFVLAAGATGLALFLLKGMGKPVQQVKEVTLVESQVLVAKKNMGLGQRVTQDDLVWKNWPKNSTDGMLTMENNRNAMRDMIGRVVKKEIDKGDPIRVKNLIDSKQGGVMAAILPAGMRAITLTFESSSSDSGLILPNDHVDLILSSEKKSETILQNIRVLAIGPELTVEKGKKVMTGRKTASLELRPSQIELVTNAKRKGTLWLSLRSIKDVNATAAVIEEEDNSKTKRVVVTRNGNIEIVESSE